MSITGNWRCTSFFMSYFSQYKGSIDVSFSNKNCLQLTSIAQCWLTDFHFFSDFLNYLRLCSWQRWKNLCYSYELLYKSVCYKYLIAFFFRGDTFNIEKQIKETNAQNMLFAPEIMWHWETVLGRIQGGWGAHPSPFATKILYIYV